MSTITLSGRAGCGKTTRGEALYLDFIRNGLHAVLVDDGEIQRNSKPELSPYSADVRIVCIPGDGPLQETTQN